MFKWVCSNVLSTSDASFSMAHKPSKSSRREKFSYLKLKRKVKQNIGKNYNKLAKPHSRLKTYLLLPQAFQGAMFIFDMAHTNSFNISGWRIWIEILQCRYRLPQALQLLSKIIDSNLLLLLYLNELVEKSPRPINLQKKQEINTGGLYVLLELTVS